MAIQAMNFFQQGASGGMQQDAYSPLGIYESENLDVFGSSQSVKASAWTTPTLVSDQVVDVDHRGRYELHKNGRVRSRAEQEYITDTTQFRGTPISDSGRRESEFYATATFGTPQKLLVHYEDDERKTIVVVTDRLMYTYLNGGKYFDEKVIKTYNCTANEYGEITKTENSTKKFTINVNIDSPGFTKSLISIRKRVGGVGDVRITKVQNFIPNSLYNHEDDRLEQTTVQGEQITFSNNIDGRDGQKEVEIEIFAYQDASSYKNGCIQIDFEVINQGGETQGHFDGFLLIDIKRKTKEYYNYLPKNTKRLTHQDGDLILIQSIRNVGIYRFVREWFYSGGMRVTWIPLLQDGNLDITRDDQIRAIITDHTTVYLRTNKDENSYLVTLSHLGERLAIKKLEEIKVLTAQLIEGIFYLVAENRGLVGLYAYYGGQIKKILGDEMVTGGWMSKTRFPFTGLMMQWRGRLYIATKDNRIYARGHNEQGVSAGAYVRSPRDDNAVNEIVAIQKHREGNYLEILYKEDGTLLSTLLLSDRETPTGLQERDKLKSYLTSFSLTTPIQIGNHFIEKQVSSLIISAMFPNKDSYLDLWLRVNDYHFWHFYGNKNVDIPIGAEFEIEEMAGMPVFVYQGKTPKGHLFWMKDELLINDGTVHLNAILRQRGGAIQLSVGKYDNFAYIGRVQQKGWGHYVERFTNLTAQLNLPWIHSYQLKVEGHCSDEYATPEIYSLHLQLDQVQR